MAQELRRARVPHYFRMIRGIEKNGGFEGSEKAAPVETFYPVVAREGVDLLA
jgi:hypothetical protein